MGTNFQPDYASPPGETLLETLEALGMSTSDLANRTSLPEGVIVAIADGRGPIEDEVAWKFEQALQVPRDFWLARERLYRSRKRELEEAQRRRQARQSLWKGVAYGAATVLLVGGAVGMFCFRRAYALKTKETEKVRQLAAEEVDAAYTAAQQPAVLPAPANSTGFVYLGRCEKTWSSKQFGGLPPCGAQIPPDGQKIISWHGDVIRTSLPTTANGQRRLGDPIGRVSAGHSLILRSIHAVSVFASGPQYYWGAVELPSWDVPSG